MVLARPSVRLVMYDLEFHWIDLVGYWRKWLSGRASPCQGEGRGFESRLPLLPLKGSLGRALFRVIMAAGRSCDCDGRSAVLAIEGCRESNLRET